MRMATDRATLPPTRLRAYAQSAHGQAKKTLKHAVRLLRIAVWRANRRLGAATCLSTAPLAWLRASTQPARARAAQAFKRTVKRTVRLLRIAVWRADRRLGAATGLSTPPLAWLRTSTQPARARAAQAFKHAAGALRSAASHTHTELHKHWPKVVASLKRLDGRPEMQGLLLGAFAMASAFFLATSNLSTREAIAERAAEDLRHLLAQVVPANLHNNNLAGDVAALDDTLEGRISFHRARMDKKVVAVVYETSGQGYTGGIKVLLGIDAAGRILGVRVLSHAETPGLGDKIEVEKSNWILGFDGLSLGNPPVAMWKVKKDGGQFDQFAGATITPRAVVAAIRRGLELFQRNREQFLELAQKPK